MHQARRKTLGEQSLFSPSLFNYKRASNEWTFQAPKFAYEWPIDVAVDCSWDILANLQTTRSRILSDKSDTLRSSLSHCFSLLLCKTGEMRINVLESEKAIAVNSLYYWIISSGTVESHGWYTSEHPTKHMRERKGKSSP